MERFFANFERLADGIMNQSIKLINADQDLLEVIMKGDDYLSEIMGWIVPENWNSFGKDIFSHVLDRIEADPAATSWWTYLPLLVESNTLIGTCGYKGVPDETGLIEIGYEVTQSYRNCGYATEIVGLLISRAFKYPAVQTIQAHTMPEEHASVRVLKKNGFEFIKEIVLGEDGRVWKFELKKS
jgi:RimJ/RimL family protein N-acetyltransferase